MKTYVVGRCDDLEPGARKHLDLDGRQIVLMNISGRYHALLNRCAHQGGPVAEGSVTCTVHATRESDWLPQPILRDGVIRCPWHGVEYDIRTGEAIGGWKWRVKVYEVRVRGGYVEICV